MSWRVLVCGGRDYPVSKVVEWLDNNLVPINVEAIVHGGAKGADLGAEKWAERHNVLRLIFPANWKERGRSAGPIRNQAMIDEGKPDMVIAFPGGRGTADMVRRATAAGLRIVEVGDTP